MDTASSVSRRSFLQTLAGAALTARAVAQNDVFLERVPQDTTLLTEAKPKIKLGMDNFSIRALGWKAPQLLDYAATQNLDTLFISDLDAFESLEDAPLRELKARADEKKIELYVGSWSICPTSTRFNKKWGSAEEHLRLGIRVSKTLGSPVFRVILGSAEDRKTEGGIRARMADTVKVLKACERDAEQAGVRIAVENHAGDMHSWELAELIEQAGRDFVGANIDTGNAAWTLEDPLGALERLGPYTICSSLRDVMAWETPEGVAIQWTAVGEGLVDWKKFLTSWSEFCPGTPFQIETISGFSRPFPYKQDDFWKHYDRKPEALAQFEALAKRGKRIENPKPAEGVDRKKAEQEAQKAELERSIAYCRKTLGLGAKAEPLSPDQKPQKS